MIRLKHNLQVTRSTETLDTTTQERVVSEENLAIKGFVTPSSSTSDVSFAGDRGFATYSIFTAPGDRLQSGDVITRVLNGRGGDAYVGLLKLRVEDAKMYGRFIQSSAVEVA